MSTLPPPLLAQLNTTHSLLLTLHKALLDHQRETYERTNGPTGTPFDTLQIVLRAEEFAWLRPLTTLLVEIDEYVSSKTPQDLAQGPALLNQARQLLQSKEDGDPFHREYFLALQHSPAAALAHAEWRLFLNALPK